MACAAHNDIQLSARLSAIAKMIPEGVTVADVGTDHAYLPISLVSSGRCPGAVASDISEGAVLRAREHVRDCGLCDRISVHVRDGLRGYLPGEQEVLIISGMGGPLMMRILQDSLDVTESFQELVLSPQSEVASVRRWLYLHHFRLTEEVLVREKGHDYFIMKARPCGSPVLDEQYVSDLKERDIQFCYGPVLIRDHAPALKGFLKREALRLEKAAAQLEAADMSRPDNVQRLKELSEERDKAWNALTLLNT